MAERHIFSLRKTGEYFSTEYNKNCAIVSVCIALLSPVILTGCGGDSPPPEGGRPGPALIKTDNNTCLYNGGRIVQFRTDNPLVNPDTTCPCSPIVEFPVGDGTFDQGRLIGGPGSCK